MPSLNPKQARFVEEYLIDLNGRQAAIRAGYSPNGAEVQASRLLSDAKVAGAIEVAQSARSIRTGISQDRVLREFARIGFGDIRGVMSWQNGSPKLRDSASLTDDEAAMISELAETEHGIKVKLHSKLDALTKIGNHLGMFRERHEHTGKNGGPIVQEVTRRQDPGTMTMEELQEEMRARMDGTV